MNNFLFASMVQLFLGYATLKIVQKYLPDRNGKFLDADGYILVFGQGLLVLGIINDRGISFFLGLTLTLCAINALIKKYLLRRKGRY